MNKTLQRIILVWAFIPYLLPSFAQTPCIDLQITSANNQLTIAGITAQNPIVKVFDHNWQFVLECGADCEEIIILSDLTTGEIYHTDVQLYDANWQFICSDQQAVEIMGGGEPCDQSICNGDIFLKKQADVDAFCACEVIKGNVQIGDYRPNVDIVDISTFSNVKRIEGKLHIFNTALEDLTGLEQIEYLGDGLQVSYNRELKSFDGLNNLSSITLLEIRDNIQLKEFNALASLTSAERVWIINSDSLVGLGGLSNIDDISVNLIISGNPGLRDLMGLNNLVAVRGNGLRISTNTGLESFSGLENLKKVEGSVQIFNNVKLKSIAAFSSLTHISDFLTIGTNPQLASLNGLENLNFWNKIDIKSNISLSDCCGISHILNPDGENSFIEIEYNSTFCNSVEEIISNCQGTLSLCDRVIISSEQNQLSIEGIVAQNPNVKIFDHNWQLAFECSTNCDETILLSDLTAGEIYHTDIQFYDANWRFICGDQQNIEITGGSGGDPCDNIQITTGNSELTISGLTAPIEIVKVFDENWQLIFDCVADCEESINLTDLVGNTFHIQISNYDEKWNFICSGDQDIALNQDRNSGLRQIEAADFLLNPNPALEATFIDLKALKGEAVTLKMYNQFGKEVYQKHIEKVVNTKEEIALSDFSNGLYLLHIQGKGKRVVAKKLMISRLY